MYRAYRFDVQDILSLAGLGHRSHDISSSHVCHKKLFCNGLPIMPDSCRKTDRNRQGKNTNLWSQNIHKSELVIQTFITKDGTRAVYMCDTGPK